MTESAVLDESDVFGPEEEERVAVSPGLVVVPAGWTESQTDRTRLRRGEPVAGPGCG